MHAGFKLLADALNDCGLDQRTVLKPSVSIPWTPVAVKEQLYKPIMQAMYKKKSTRDLLKNGEVSEVWDVLCRHLSEKFGFEAPDFPHYESEEEYIKDTTS